MFSPTSRPQRSPLKTRVALQPTYDAANRWEGENHPFSDDRLDPTLPGEQRQGKTSSATKEARDPPLELMASHR